ncbi:MAG: hypothetical protein LUO80_12995 [Methylococcaceae bacterium]|nr:hypothetical protein [Methylococcaceae bacterium]
MEARAAPEISLESSAQGIVVWSFAARTLRDDLAERRDYEVYQWPM